MSPVATLIDTSVTTKHGELANSRDASTSATNVRQNDDDETKLDDKLRDIRNHSEGTTTSVARPEEQLEKTRLKEGPPVYIESEITGQLCYQSPTVQSLKNLPEMGDSPVSPVLSPEDASKLAKLERRNSKESTAFRSDKAFSDYRQRVRKDLERHRNPLCVS